MSYNFFCMCMFLVAHSENRRFFCLARDIINLDGRPAEDWRLQSRQRDRQVVILGWTDNNVLIKAAYPIDLYINAFTGTVFAQKPTERTGEPHYVCTLTQLYNRNHAVHWILSSYCKSQQVSPGAGEEMVNMWIYTHNLLLQWHQYRQPSPQRHGLLFVVKTVWSLCLSVFYRPVKTPVLHAGSQWEAPGPHL